jgi:hypothetical protein
VVIAPAFKNLGRNPITGKYCPGIANARIAQKLEECADRFQLVLTQKAVSDALQDHEMLPDGTPVVQMHEDNDRAVGTLGGLYCAIERLEGFPQTTRLGLIAHDKHLARARQALEAVIAEKFPNAESVDIHLGQTPYQDDSPFRPWEWAAREMLTRPIQSLQILKGRVWGFSCSENVKIRSSSEFMLQ